MSINFLVINKKIMKCLWKRTYEKFKTEHKYGYNGYLKGRI